jgi:hypothetical protein
MPGYVCLACESLLSNATEAIVSAGLRRLMVIVCVELLKKEAPLGGGNFRICKCPSDRRNGHKLQRFVTMSHVCHLGLTGVKQVCYQ